MSQTEVQLIKNGAVVDADINGMSSSKLSGALPAISGASLTNLPTPAGKVRNLVINGAMQVAQRGTSSTASGMKTVDRFNCSSSGTDETPTQEQADVASGTTPYTSGFKKSYKITNGNQTSGAGSSDAIQIEYKSESQDIANSGWNFKSATSFLTMSFWVKSSVAQEFQCQLYNSDTNKAYLFTYTVSSADTWQKITHSVKGDSNLNFNVDNGAGLECAWYLFIGTDQTVANPTENTWATYSGTSTKKDAVSTWYTTNNATFEITGVQWEVGSVATDFEHRLFAQELALCQRYCCIFSDTSGYGFYTDYDAPSVFTANITLPVEMRAEPTITQTGSGGTNNSGFVYSNLQGDPIFTATGRYTVNAHHNVVSAGRAYMYMANSAELTMEAEL